VFTDVWLRRLGKLADSQEERFDTDHVVTRTRSLPDLKSKPRKTILIEFFNAFVGAYEVLENGKRLSSALRRHAGEVRHTDDANDVTNSYGLASHISARLPFHVYLLKAPFQSPLGLVRQFSQCCLMQMVRRDHAQ
jgi:hypothetical protein